MAIVNPLVVFDDVLHSGDATACWLGSGTCKRLIPLFINELSVTRQDSSWVVRWLGTGW